MFGIGAGEFVVIIIVALIVFGPSKLPEIGKSLGKLLREFRKAQSALSATLNEIDEPAKKSEPPPPAPEKKSAAQGVTADDVIHAAKVQPLTTSAQGVTANDVIHAAKERPISNREKISAPSTATADVIHSAKEQPTVKENSNEKISDGNSDDAPADNARASLAGAGGSSNGIDKQSQPAADGTLNPRR